LVYGRIWSPETGTPPGSDRLEIATDWSRAAAFGGRNIRPAVNARRDEELAGVGFDITGSGI